MKKHFYIFIFLLFSSKIFAQSITIDAANPSNIIKAESVNQGILVPKMTHLQKNQIPILNRVEGMMVFDIDAKQFSYWVDGVWINLSNVTSTNGLTQTGTNVKLGGVLTENTAFSGTTNVDFNNTGTFKIANLGGSGTQMMVTDNAGIVSKQAIPTTESTVATNGLTQTGTNVKLGGVLTENTSITGVSDIDFSNTGTFKIANLGGDAGLKMVVTDISGVLSKQTIPNTESTTATNGLTLTGTNVKLGGVLTENTAFTGSNRH